jgi:integrase
MSPSPFTQGSSALRVFDELSRGAADHWSDGMTLSAFYYFPEKDEHRGFRLMLERLRKSSRTIAQYDQSIGYWALYARGKIDEAGLARPAAEPKLREIGEDVLSFQFVLAAVPGVGSSNTIRKHVTHVQAVLDRCGPRARDKRLRLAVGLIADVPLLEKPPEFEHEVQDDFQTDEISAVLGACRVARVPSYLPPEQRARWWRNLITVDCQTPLRIGSLIAGRWDKLFVERDRWWWIVPLKGHKEKRVCVNQVAMAAIEDMRALTGPFPEIFHWPNELNWLIDNHGLIMQAGGLARERHCGFHGYRKWFLNESSELDAFGAGMQAGHSFDAMLKHYVTKKRMATAVENLPAPKAPSHQLKLF